MKKTFLKYFFTCNILLFILGCTDLSKINPENILQFPEIKPDYTNITIPLNIAPLNFQVKEDGLAFFVQFSYDSQILMEIFSKSGKILIPLSKWKKILKDNINQDIQITVFCKDKQGQWKKFKPFNINISADPIDPFLSYRLLYPGFEAYTDLSIKQRCLENFKVHSLIENSIIDNNCINCHTFNPDNQSDFFFHARGIFGGTYFFRNKVLKKHNLKSPEMENNPVYSRWHPSGNFIAFSSNKTGQLFHASETKKIEVIDLASSLILYDIIQNEVLQIDIPGKEINMDTYPEWSPDGKYLYFCRAIKPDIPELSTRKIVLTPGKIRNIAKSEAIQTK